MSMDNSERSYQNDDPSPTEQKRPSMLVTMIRKAFSLDYEQPASAEDLESFVDDAEDDGFRSTATRNESKQWRIIGISVLILLLAASLFAGSSRNRRNLPPARPVSGGTCPAQDPVLAMRSFSSIEGVENGAVASDHPKCSEIGVSLLKKGGNAVDAAVGVALCLDVANPASSGIGGGSFILIHSDPVDESREMPPFHDAREGPSPKAKSGKITEVIDAREVAPLQASTDMFSGKAKNASVFGGLAVAVPGALRGLELAHARHGKLTWAQVVEPAMLLAREGVRVNENLAHEITLVAKMVKDAPDYGLRQMLTWNDDWRAPYKEGDSMKQPTLAETLEAISKDGSGALYSGSRAEKLAQEIQAAGGIITTQDIESFQATIRTPVVAHDINGYSIVGVPPPSSGGAAIIGAARFLAGYTSPFAAALGALSLHRTVEALKHVFAIRMSLSDPSYNTETVMDAVYDLTTGDYIDGLRGATLDNSTLPLHKYGGSKWAQLKDSDGKGNASDAQEGDRRLIRKYGYLEDHGTSHFSVIDKDGNAVAMTTSVNTYFGSKVVSVSNGIVLNNQMDDFGIPGEADFFGLKPSEANFIKPAKKPLSSMSPTLLFANSGQSEVLGELRLSIGASGGPKIISAVLQVLTRHIFAGVPLFDAIVDARIHDQLIYHGASVTGTEQSKTVNGAAIDLSDRSRTALTKRGHNTLDLDYTGTVQAVSVDSETGLLSAACDVRKGGTPDGY